MIYTLKNDSGKVIAVSDQQVTSKWQKSDLQDSALQAFLKRNPIVSDKVMKSADADFIRALEDLIDLLIDKQVIQFTDLPVPVQSKLLNRRMVRDQIRRKDNAHLMDKDDDIF